MSDVRIGINGFGRMGRLVTRVFGDMDGLDVVHVNEVKGTAETAAHLLEFDTVHGRWGGDVSFDGDTLRISGSNVVFTSEPTPETIDWSSSGVDIVLDCSGKFRTVDGLTPHLSGSPKRVVVAVPVKDERVLNVVMGCNDELYDPAEHSIVTAASCTTNCLAPVVKVIHEGLGIERGVITTIHDVTNTQVIVDLPHKDLRRARSALNSLIPTSTGSATAITMIYPELTGKLDGLAVRAPLLNASLTDCVFDVGREVTADEVNALLNAAADGPLAGILGYEERPLVSADYVNDPRSGIVDALSTNVIDGTMVKVLAWYDNEWGYVNRLAELTAKVAASL